MNEMPNFEQAKTMTDSKISANKVQVYYGDTHAIKDVDIEIQPRSVTASSVRPGVASRRSCGRSTE